MPQFKIILPLLAFSMSSCLHKRQDTEIIDSKYHQANFKVYGNYKICDTCKTVVLVSHSNCLFSDEVNVESGILLIPNHIIDSFKNSLLQDSISKLRATVDSVFDFQIKSYLKNQVLLNTNKIYLRGFSNSLTLENGDYFRIFRLTGKVIDIRRRVLMSGVMDSIYSIYFLADSIIKTDKVKVCGN